jgi:hypothetical protein
MNTGRSRRKPRRKSVGARTVRAGDPHVSVASSDGADDDEHDDEEEDEPVVDEDDEPVFDDDDEPVVDEEEEHDDEDAKVEAAPRSAAGTRKRRNADSDAKEEADALLARHGAGDEDAALEEAAGQAGSVGARRARRREAANASTSRNKRRAAAGTMAQYYAKPERGMWNERSRPGFDQATRDAVWANAGHTDAGGNPVFQCRGPDGTGCTNPARPAGGVFPVSAMTLDHKVQWKAYILGTAAPEDDGRISQASAKAAYNDTDNLVPMCQSCNSKKNGEKGKYD